MKFICGYGYEGEQPRLYAERVNTGGWHWRLVGFSGVLAEDFAADYDELLTQASETAREILS